MTRLRRLLWSIESHARTDWPVWAVLGVSALAGAYVGWRHGVVWGLPVGLFAPAMIVYGAIGPAYKEKGGPS